jgi:hypothetical protein
MYQLIIDKGVDVVLAALGVWIGYKLALSADAKQRQLDQTTRRKELLQQLLASLEQNLKYLNQITGLHFKRGELPTFHLDTTWLHYFTSTVCLDIPSVSKYREAYNNLRFELDHINRKLDLLFFMAPSEELHAANSNPSSEQKGFTELYDSTVLHIKAMKDKLTDEIGALKSLKD